MDERNEIESRFHFVDMQAIHWDVEESVVHNWWFTT